MASLPNILTLLRILLVPFLVVVLLTFPFTVVTLGLFLLVINAGMLALVASLLPKFSIDGFGSALLGAMVVSLVSWIASLSIGPDGRIEVIRVEDRPPH